MAQLKASPTRIAANDLFSTYPNGQGGLEADLCTIFGFTPNVDITESAFILDNSGRITNSLLEQQATEIPVLGGTESNGIGLQITDSNASKTAIIGQNTSTGGQLFTVAEPYVGALFDPVFSIDMTNGNMTGYTTQDGSSNPLLPPPPGGATGGNPNYYYNSLGQWSIPGFLPFNGCRINSKSTVINSGSSGFLGLFTQGSDYFDVGGHFDGVNKISAITAGKYFVHAQCAVVGSGGIGLNASIELQDDGGNNLAFASYDGSSLSQFLAMSTVWNASSGSSWLKINCTANAVLGSSGATFGSDNGILDRTKLFNGSITFFQIG